MAIKKPQEISAHDIGYVMGKMEMLEKKFDEHRVESRKELELVLDKLDQMTQTLSFWRHTLWLLKAIGLSIPFIMTANFHSLAEIWKDF